MNKWKMLLVLTLAVGLGFAGKANGGVTLYERGIGTAVWSKDTVISGDYSVKLTIPINSTWDDAARVKVSYDSLFSTITNANLKYWYFYDGVAHNSFVRLDIDADGNGIRDRCLISQKQAATVYNGVWTETIQSDYWHGYTIVEATQAADADMGWKTMAEWQAAVVDTFPPLTSIVTYFFVMMGPTSVPSAQTDTMYIDSITIGSVTYAVEPATPFKLVWTEPPGTARLQTWGDANAECTIKHPPGYSGSYSVKLTTTTASWDSVAQVKVLYNELLTTIDHGDLKYWIYVETAQNPYSVLYLDTLGGSEVNYQLHSDRVDDQTKDAWVNTDASWADQWIPHFYDPNAPCGAQDGSAQTIAGWHTTYPNAKVIYVALQYGNIASGVLYAGDITIDGITYDLIATTEAGVDLNTGEVSVQAADPDSGLIDTTNVVVTVKAYRADNDLLSDGLWNAGTDYNTVGIDDTTTNGVANIVDTEFDFSKVGTYYFTATSTGLTSGNSDNVTITYNQDKATMEVLLTTPASMGVNTADSVSVIVKDEYGNIVTGTGAETVNFSRFVGGAWTSGDISVSATGYAAEAYTSGTCVLTGDSLRAYVKNQAANFADTNRIALTPGALTTIGATPPDYGITNTALRVVCDSLSGPFGVELQDSWGNHIDAEDVTGKKITIGTVHGPLGGSVVSAPVLYGGAGSKVWRFYYTGGDTVDAVEDTIPIGITGSPGLCDIEVYALVIGGPIADDSLAMTLSGDEVVVCDDSSLEITCEIIDAKDIYGNLTEGREITFGITGSDGSAIGAAGAACTTDAGGDVAAGHVAYKAGSKAQIIYLTATATDGGAWAKDTIYLEAEQGHAQIDSIAITGVNAISAGQEESLTFTYFDEFGNIVNILYDPPDTVFDNDTLVGTLSATTIDTVVKDTLVIYDDATRARVYGVRLKKDYTGEPTLTETKVDTIVATAGAAVDTFLMTVVPTGEAAYFMVTFPAAQDTLTVNNAVTLTITAFDPDSNRVYIYGTDTIPTEITLTHTGTADSLMWRGDSVIDNRDGTGTIYDTIFGDGQAIVKLTNRTAETLTASVAETGKLAAGTSDTITWIPDALEHFGIVAQTDPIYTGVPFAFTVTPYDTFDNVTSLGLPVWIEFGTNEAEADLPAGPLQFTDTTTYTATAPNATTSMILTVGTTDGLIHGISDPFTVIGLYTLSGTVELSDNPGDLSGSKVMVSGGFFDSTDVIGHYEIPGLLEDTYNIIVTHEGYKIEFETGVNISANTVRNFMLEPEVGIEEIPTVYSLSQNRPNPFSTGTTIEYGIPKAGNVEIVVYNVVGQKVRTLVDAKQGAGYYKMKWDGTDDRGARVGGGIYFYKITAGEFTSLKKLILLR